MAVIVLDTNILVLLSKKQIEAAEVFKHKSLYCVSVISYIELLSYKHLTKEEANFFTSIFNQLNIIYLDEDLVEKTINIRKNSALKLPDAIIAATAYKNNALLISNDADFNKVKEIKVQAISLLPSN